MRRRGEAGQVLPWVAMAIVAAAFLAILAAKTTIAKYRQMRLESGVDATALAAGTAYARGLNVAAVFNYLLVPAAAYDAILHCPEPPKPPVPSVLQYTLIKFQDQWAGTGKASLNIAPAAMEIAALVTGYGNGILTIPIWNQEPGGSDGGDGDKEKDKKKDKKKNKDKNKGGKKDSPLKPSLNLKRASWGNVETLKTPVCGDDSPLPLQQEEEVHTVTIIGTPKAGLGKGIPPLAIATAEVSGGSMWNPGWGVRLVKPPEGLERDVELLSVLSDPQAFRAWLMDQVFGDVPDCFRKYIPGLE